MGLQGRQLLHGQRRDEGGVPHVAVSSAYPAFTARCAKVLLDSILIRLQIRLAVLRPAKQAVNTHNCCFGCGQLHWLQQRASTMCKRVRLGWLHLHTMPLRQSDQSLLIISDATFLLMGDAGSAVSWARAC